MVRLSVNEMLEEYLHHYATTTQTNWLELLEPVQLYYNLQQILAMGMCPFEVAIGLQPHTPLDMLVSEKPSHNMSPAAYKFTKT